MIIIIIFLLSDLHFEQLQPGGRVAKYITPPAPPATNKTITQQVTARQRIISNTARLYLQQSQYTSGWLTGLGSLMWRDL